MGRPPVAKRLPWPGELSAKLTERSFFVHIRDCLRWVNALRWGQRGQGDSDFLSRPALLRNAGYASANFQFARRSFALLPFDLRPLWTPL